VPKKAKGMRMLYVTRITAVLCFCASLVIVNACVTRESELQNSERMKTMKDQKTMHQKSSEWLTYVREKIASKTGTFITKDATGMPIELEWERIESLSPRLNEKIKSLSEILVQAYTYQEVQFARKYPEAVPNEYFLKHVASLFKDGVEKVNWNLVEEQLKAIFHQLFTTTDFGQFSGTEDIHLFVVAKDKETKLSLGLIQFLITPEYAFGTVKAAYFGVMPAAQNRGLEKLLTSSIFAVLPNVTRIFLHTRITNEKALVAYNSWGFTQFSGPLAFWTDMEYRAGQSTILQKTAETLVERS
jgi:ribosomal protein S18 acetylase RimI-like enzyme